MTIHELNILPKEEQVATLMKCCGSVTWVNKMLTDNILDLIGNTPLIKLTDENIHAKAELLNPGGSIKDRTERYFSTALL